MPHVTCHMPQQDVQQADGASRSRHARARCCASSHVLGARALHATAESPAQRCGRGSTAPSCARPRPRGGSRGHVPPSVRAHTAHALSPCPSSAARRVGGAHNPPSFPRRFFLELLVVVFFFFFFCFFVLPPPPPSSSSPAHSRICSRSSSSRSFRASHRANNNGGRNPPPPDESTHRLALVESPECLLAASPLATRRCVRSRSA